MVTALPIPMDEAAVTLAQWVSPGFPVGAFAYSHGLERAIHEGRVTDAEGLHDWLADLLTHGAGRTDAVLVRCAHAAADTDEVLHIDASARAFAGTAERLTETRLQGAALARTISAIWPFDLPDLVYPVALGRAAALAGLPGDLTVVMSLHAFVANLTSAAVRLVPLGQTQGQAVLARLAPLCHRVAAETRGAGLNDLAGQAFLSDIMAMRHETQETRLFRT